MDLYGPKCVECSGFGHIQADCGNLKLAKRKALHATLSDDSSKDQRILALIALHADYEESQSSDEEELREAYGILYFKFTKLRETNQKNVMELNTMKTEKSTLLHKITDLKEKLMDTQLQLQKFSDNKLAQMLTRQKCSFDKTGLEYVATTDASNIASTSKTVFVKRSVLEP
jgi:hypothetical protein